MKKTKQLNNSAKKAALLSFDALGEISEERVKKQISHFKILPLSQSLPLLHFYLKALKKEIASRTLIIESAVGISTSQVEKIKQSVKRHSTISKVETNINHALLGGVKVKIGDMVYNDSLSEKISQLKKIAYE